MGKVFAVTSGKGGVGKSTFSVGLGYAFCQKGKKVLLIDMDEGIRCLDLILGVDKVAVFDLCDILMGKDIEDAVYTSDFAEGLHLIPAPAKTGMIDKIAFSHFAERVKELYDIVIFDFPAGVEMTLYSCLPKSTLFLTVAVPDPVSIRDAAVVGTALSKKGLRARLVINRFIYKQSRKFKIKNIDGIIDTTAIRLIGIVPESEELTMLSLKHKLSRKGKAAKAYGRIADRLSGEQRLLPKMSRI